MSLLKNRKFLAPLLVVIFICAIVAATALLYRPDVVDLGKRIPLHELSVSVDMPGGFVADSPESLKALKEQMAAAEPLAPFQDVLMYIFRNRASNAVLSISRLWPLDVDPAVGNKTSDPPYDGEKYLDEYHRNLEKHFGTELPWEARDQDGKLIRVMNIDVKSGGKTAHVTKVLYFFPPHRFFVFDLYTNPEAEAEGDAQLYDHLFGSVRDIYRAAGGLRCCNLPGLKGPGSFWSFGKPKLQV